MTKQAVREAATICPTPCKLPVGGRPDVASLYRLGPMYATDRHQTRIIA